MYGRRSTYPFRFRPKGVGAAPGTGGARSVRGEGRHRRGNVQPRPPRGARVEGGIDEAGRGPVLGPLVIAGVATADPDALWVLGCRDSKRLSPERRERLGRLIAADPAIHCTTVVIAAEQLDALRATRNMNEIEVAAFGDVAGQLAAAGARHVHLDAADVDADRFGARVAALARSAGGADVRVTATHRADGDVPAVAAASIVAKVERDRHIAQLARRLERRLDMRLGSGYPSDPATRAFLAQWVARFGDLPPGTRRTWKTAHDLLAPRPAGLPDFGKP